ncbi:lipase 3 [Aethina tumida]|uniref:lipase 3 n=1 Tax=Aethina tumida TaxID=116153 RepID=UPI00214960E4|nr:lipase 3 [Aethina tumida]
MKLVIVLVALFGTVYLNAVPTLNQHHEQPELELPYDEEAHMKVPELLQKHGYPCETYQIQTSDNYLLTVHRIPSGVTGKNNGRVAFLQHGLISSSADWIITGPGKGLAYILADLGYDVWMGNGRGNTYSRNHTVYNPDKDSKFWQFSWHEIGAIDLPAMIDLTLEITGADGVYYVGHSQGTTSYYVMLSEHPEYNNKIKVHVSMAPIAYMNHMTSPLLKLIAFWNKTLGALMSLIGINEFLPSSDFLALAGSALCSDDSLTQVLCTNGLFAICGFNKDEMNATMLPTLMGHTPAGSSTRQFLHYGQEIKSGYFRQYDHGLIGNIKAYGKATPPKYDLSKITAPIYIIYSNNDWLSATKDVDRLYNQLTNAPTKAKFLLSNNKINHVDYMYGIHAPTLIYNKVISLFARH